MFVLDSLVRDAKARQAYRLNARPEGRSCNHRCNTCWKNLEHLSPERLAELDDFIDFLRQSDQDKRLRQDYAHASEAAFDKVWDNDLVPCFTSTSTYIGGVPLFPLPTEGG